MTSLLQPLFIIIGQEMATHLLRHSFRTGSQLPETNSGLFGIALMGMGLLCAAANYWWKRRQMGRLVRLTWYQMIWICVPLLAIVAVGMNTNKGGLGVAIVSCGLGVSAIMVNSWIFQSPQYSGCKYTATCGVTMLSVLLMFVVIGIF